MDERGPFLSAVLLLVGALLTVGSAPVAAAGPAAPASCHGEVATIVGTEGRDRLRGTPGRDVIAGLGGNDRIAGRGGADVVCGGDGADELTGGRGGDLLFGGRDLVEGGQTPYHRGDALVGGAGDDLLDAGDDPRVGDDGGGDTVIWTGSRRAVHVDLAAGTATGEGRDRVRLGDGGRVHLSFHDDTLVGSPAAEEVHGFDGSDDIRTGGGDDTVWLDDVEEIDDDRARTGAGRDTVWSLGGSDVVRTQKGRDALHLVGDQFLVQAWAGAADDLVEVVVPVGGEHVVSGGDGEDLVRLEVLDDAPGDHAVDLATGVLLLGPAAPASTVAGFEDAELYGGRFAVRGTSGPNRVLVNLAARFDGLEGDDSFGGSAEDDTFDGGPGDDTYLADPGGTNTCASVEQDPLAVCAGP